MTDESLTSRARQSDPLSALWRLFAAPWALTALAGSIALALVLRTLIPQIPTETQADPQAWMALLPGVFGQRSGLFHAVGLFEVADAFWFHLLLALTGLVLFVRTFESAELAWRALGRGNGALAKAKRPLALDSLGSLATPLSAEDGLVRMRRVLVENGLQVTGIANHRALLARRRTLLLWTQPLSYAALLVALIGLAITATFGWQLNDWRPVPGESLDVGHNTSYTLRMDSFDLHLDDNGQLLDYQSQITWNENDKVGSQPPVSIGRPATHGATAVHLIGFVPSVQLRGWDETGRPLAFQAEGQEVSTPGKVDVSFPSLEAQPLIYLPDQDQFLALAFEANCPDGQPALNLALAAVPGQTLSSQSISKTLTQSGDVTLPGLRLEVDLSYRPTLRVSHRPAFGLVLAALTLALGALATGWVAPSRLLWIEVGPGSDGETVVRLTGLACLTGSRWWLELVSELGQRLASDD